MTTEDLIACYTEKHSFQPGIILRLVEIVADQLIRLQPDLPTDKSLAVLEAGLLNMKRELHGRLTDSLKTTDSIEMTYGDQPLVFRLEHLPLLGPNN